MSGAPAEVVAVPDGRPTRYVVQDFEHVEYIVVTPGQEQRLGGRPGEIIDSSAEDVSEEILWR